MEAYADYLAARARLLAVLESDDAAIAREYYRSQARPLDEARIERIHGVAQEMDRCQSATREQLAKWSARLWKA